MRISQLMSFNNFDKSDVAISTMRFYWIQIVHLPFLMFEVADEIIKFTNVVLTSIRNSWCYPSPAYAGMWRTVSMQLRRIYANE